MTDKTPRTDAVARKGRLFHEGWYTKENGEWVEAEFARQLERELAAQSKAAPPVPTVEGKGSVQYGDGQDGAALLPMEPNTLEGKPTGLWAWYVLALRAELMAAREELANAEGYGGIVHDMLQLQQRADSAERRERATQAKIDALMLEYCPDEMTPEQIENWEKHQKPVSDSDAAIITRAKERQ